MDPHQRYRDHVTSRRDVHLPQGAADTSAGGETADQNPPRSMHLTEEPHLRQTDGRSMAQREEEELQRWRETHRVSSVHENPERLAEEGGAGEEEEAGGGEQQRRMKAEQRQKFTSEVLQQHEDLCSSTVTALPVSIITYNINT
ncbi:hypothetical protein INR49_006626 [Caranx melampygus]|nr:hypothetical protein INR49_006626 [Caranx melampygus]